MTKTLKEYYSESNTIRVIKTGAVFAGFIVLMLGLFTFLGPVSNILLGWPLYLSLPLALVIPPFVGVLVWPFFDWATDKASE